MRCKCGNELTAIEHVHDDHNPEYDVTILWCNQCGRVLKKGYVVDQIGDRGTCTKDIADWYEPANVMGGCPDIPSYYCKECAMPPHNCICTHEG